MPLKAYVVTGDAPKLSLTEISADTIEALPLPGTYRSLEEACKARDRLIRQNDAEHYARRTREAGTSERVNYVSLL